MLGDLLGGREGTVGILDSLGVDRLGGLVQAL